ncbi:3-dehydroquinate dehydratase [Rhodotorula toruloides]|uniref:Catabolic 3-dehydroquinase n=1 Tax=Rhodotorula toruloides TaxID=5286 RepID=A0A511KM07_RHOTO|nr:3-dehydroquinate dehydratase [Rhodotorula toruloides]
MWTPSFALQTSTGVRRITKVDPSDALDKPNDPKTFLLLSGVNHALYGTTTLAQIEERVTELGKELGVEVVCAQTDYEGEMCQLIHYSRCLGGVIMNPGAWAHYSYALRDAIDACDSPVIEVHISNVSEGVRYAREEFRHKSVTAPVVKGYIAACGVLGYELGLRTAIERRRERDEEGKVK